MIQENLSQADTKLDPRVQAVEERLRQPENILRLK